MHLLVWNMPKKWEKSSGICLFEKAHSAECASLKKKSAKKRHIPELMFRVLQNVRNLPKKRTFFLPKPSNDKNEIKKQVLVY
jgi:hypothetical protein